MPPIQEFASPRVSVVMAAYHRPAVMAYAIRSVLAQSLPSWELLVVGDHCTDATEAVARSFSHPRIQFHNLPENVGDQSGPNNFGCGRARGEFVAFLNQDDLWLPRHLETAVTALERSEADLVFSAHLAAFSPEVRCLVPAPGGGRYEPHRFEPASTWVFRRTLWERVGPWKHHTRCYAAPSQEWLFRAWRRGARLASLPWPDVVTPFSGSRAGSYRDGATAEHESFAARIREEPDFMRREAIRTVAQTFGGRPAGLPGFVRGPSPWVRVASRLLGSIGVHSQAAENFLRFRGRGGFVRRLRRHRGLDTAS